MATEFNFDFSGTYTQLNLLISFSTLDSIKLMMMILNALLCFSFV